MQTSKQLATHFRQLYFGGNWTWVNLKDALKEIGWEQAISKVKDFNTIAILVYHIGYYVSVQLKVLKGGNLEGTDKDSFNCQPIQSAEDWESLLSKTWQEGEEYAALVEQLPDQHLEEVFVMEKYGNWHRNLMGLIEHAHYHLGQIVMLKKMMQSDKA